MNAKAFSELLESLQACDEAREWANGKTLKQVWDRCERADWMLWLCARMIGKPDWPTHQQVVLAACACAERSLRFVAEGEKRPAQAIAAARRWAEKPTEENRAAAWAAAGAAAEAAWAAAGAAAEAAWAAAGAAAEAAWAAEAAEAARAAWMKIMADLIREPLRPKNA